MRTKTTSKILSETSDETKQKVRNNADNLITKIKEYQDTETAFLRGYKLAQERSYSEEDMRKAYFSGISSTGEGWNGEYADGNDPNIEEKFSKGFTQWFEQFKKK